MKIKHTNSHSKARACLRIILDCALLAIVLLTPASAQTESVIYSFAGQPADGGQPSADLIKDSHGNFYSTTYAGGSSNAGTLFKLSPSGGSWTESMLVSLGGPLGPANPVAPVVISSTGNLYTTAASGGAANVGEVFEVSKIGGLWEVTGSLSFGASGNGKYPYAGLTADSHGNYYGTTAGGGSCGEGTVYELTPGSTWIVTVLHSFCGGGNDGSGPQGGLIMDSSGNLYGTTIAGGTTTYGTVFELSPSSDSSWTLTVLHSFGTAGDGISPVASLIMDESGNLYGTTEGGGLYGAGTAFKLTSAGGVWTEDEIVGFEGGAKDGAAPTGRLLLDKKGNLYGTTSFGGTNNSGTVFRLSGAPWRKTILHSFGNSGDGRNPYAGLIMDSTGALYGTTYGGGANGHGTVFKLVP